jgi:ankyrin repeat protein
MNESFSVLLDGDEHTIALNYEPLRSMWVVIDANQLPATILPVDKLASWVKAALLESGNMTMFASSIYVAGNHFSRVERKINEVMIQSPDFAALHKIDDHKKNYTNSRQVTLAYIAARGGHPDVIESLRQVGADFNKANRKGVTPVLAAAYSGYVVMIKMLCQAGANLEQANNDGETPAFVAAQNGDAAVLELLRQKGADVNIARHDGVTPVFAAAQEGHAAVIKALYQAGANVNKANPDGATPAIIAAECGHVAAIKMLYQAGANLNKAKNNGVTPAFVAAYCNHVPVLAALEAADVDLTIRTPFGTPLEAARAKGNKASVEFLEDYTRRRMLKDYTRRRMLIGPALTFFAAAAHHGNESAGIRISNGM